MISNEVFSKNLKTGNLSVRIESLDHFDKDQKKAWPSICKKFSQKFVIGKGFWSSGIAKKAGCELTRDQIKHLNSIEGMKTPKNDSRITSKPSYELKIKIEGEIPERKDEDENIAEKFIGKAVGFWDGFKRQLFSTKNPDERKIIFELNYLHNKKPIYMAKRIYNYSDKFLGYFDLDGFIDLLAFDILIESPYQWDISILKKREFLDGLDKKKMFSFEKIDNAVNLERNLNLYFVRPKITF
jgi:hypothetical protein